MIDEYVPSDKHHDDINEQIMERRVQMIKDREDSITDDSFPSPIAPLSSTLTALPTNRIRSW